MIPCLLMALSAGGWSMAGKKWEAEEDRTAVQMLRGGASAAEVARHLGRSAPSVRQRNSLRWKIPASRWWSSGDDRRGAEMVRAGAPMAEIAESLGRTPTAIMSRNHEVWGERHPQYWSAEDDCVLREMWESGASAEDIAEHLDRGVSAVLFRKQQFQFDRRDRKHPKTNLDFFREWTPRSAYVHGLIAADGCVHDHLRDVGGRKYRNYKVDVGQSGGPEVRAYLEGIQAHSGGAVYGPYLREGKKPAYKIVWLGKALCGLLQLRFLTPRKSLTLRLPDVPESLWAHFVRGVMDGDGSLSAGGATRERRLRGKDGLVVSLGSGSRRFRDGIADVVERRAGVRGSRFTTTRGRKNPEHRLGWSWGSAMRVAEWLYAEADGSFFMPRKRAVYDRRKQLGSN